MNQKRNRKVTQCLYVAAVNKELRVERRKETYVSTDVREPKRRVYGKKEIRNKQSRLPENCQCKFCRDRRNLKSITNRELK